VYRPEDDWNAMVADEIERECGTRPALDDFDAEADAALDVDYANWLFDLAAQADPLPTDGELDAMAAYFDAAA
jgi:hypothetical protein